MSESEDLPLPSYKVVILGDSSVGKTSLAHRFTTDEFDTNLANTIGAAFITKDYQSTTKNKSLRFEIWDTAGQERYRSLTPMYYRNAKVALICYDLSNVDYSFSKARYWIDQLNLNNDSANDNEIKIMLVGTKRDLVDSTNSNVISDFKDENPKIKHFITSSRTGEGITDIFDTVIDEIPDEFFDSHYKKLREQENVNNKTQGINFLNNQFTSSSNSSCC